MSIPEHLLGHETTVQRLLRASRGGGLTHALLLTGPEGVGKTSAALTLAAGVIEAGSWPGGALAHPDLWLEDGESENVSIQRVRAGGEELPTLQDFLSLRAYAGGRRVAVLARADRLTESAANCILKTVEEPPPGAHLVLTAAHPEKLPATVLSRCEQVALHPVPASEIERWLAGELGVAAELAALAAPLAAGRPGRALRLAREPGALERELQAVDAFLATGGGGTAAALQTAAACAPGAGAEGRERALVTLAAWSSFARDAACYASGAPELGTWAVYRPALERWAEDLSPARIVQILGRLAEAIDAVATYAQPRLAFEALLLDVFAGAESPPLVPPRRPDPVVLPGAPSAGAAAARPRRAPAAARGRARGGGSAAH